MTEKWINKYNNTIYRENNYITLKRTKLIREDNTEYEYVTLEIGTKYPDNTQRYSKLNIEISLFNSLFDDEIIMKVVNSIKEIKNIK
jgi:transposase